MTNLPNGYKEVEYIESSGTQYIDTGYDIQTGDTVEIKFNMLTYTGGSSGEQWIYSIWANNVGYRAGVNHGGWETGDGFTYDTTGYNTDIITTGTSSYNFSYSGYLFAQNEEGSVAHLNQGTQRLFYCKISSGGILVRNFVPCYRISDSVIGMYDTVNNVFYTNAGTGTFTKGADVIHTKYIDRYYLNGECYGIKFGESTPERQGDMDNWALAQTSSALSGTWRGGISVNNDGTKLYLSQGDYVREYIMNTPYDISSFTLNYTLTYSGVEDIYFKPDGTKLYVIGGTDAISIRQYNLSTAWDLSTASSYTTIVNTGGQRGIYITPDGTGITVSGHPSYNKTYTNTMSTPRDLSTLGTRSEVSGGGIGCTFGNNGLYYFVQETESTTNLTYKTCSTPYDLTTATTTGTKNVGTCRAAGIWFNNSGTICMIVGGGNSTNYVTKYTL